MSVLWVALFASLGAMYWYQTSFDRRLISMNERADAIDQGPFQVETPGLSDGCWHVCPRVQEIRSGGGR